MVIKAPARSFLKSLKGEGRGIETQENQATLLLKLPNSCKTFQMAKGYMAELEAGVKTAIHRITNFQSWKGTPDILQPGPIILYQ